jgi:hypothetical protein
MLCSVVRGWATHTRFCIFTPLDLRGRNSLHCIPPRILSDSHTALSVDSIMLQVCCIMLAEKTSLQGTHGVVVHSNISVLLLPLQIDIGV